MSGSYPTKAVALLLDESRAYGYTCGVADIHDTRPSSCGLLILLHKTPNSKYDGMNNYTHALDVYFTNTEIVI